MNTEKIEIGSVVTLKSGGPKMTVECWREPNMAMCRYWVGQQFLKLDFPLQIIRLAEPQGQCGNPLTPAGQCATTNASSEPHDWQIDTLAKLLSEYINKAGALSIKLQICEADLERVRRMVLAPQ